VCYSQPLVVPVLSIVIAWTRYLPAIPTAGLHSSARLLDFLLKLSQRTFVPSSLEYSFRKASAKDYPNFHVINIHIQRSKCMRKILFLLKSVEKAHRSMSRVGGEMDSQFVVYQPCECPISLGSPGPQGVMESVAQRQWQRGPRCLCTEPTLLSRSSLCCPTAISTALREPSSAGAAAK